MVRGSGSSKFADSFVNFCLSKVKCCGRRGDRKLDSLIKPAQKKAGTVGIKCHAPRVMKKGSDRCTASFC